eukprot:scaffold56037_cov31-Phaeocystis_antarctica.AAC.1
MAAAGSATAPAAMARHMHCTDERHRGLELETKGHDVFGRGRCCDGAGAVQHAEGGEQLEQKGGVGRRRLLLLVRHREISGRGVEGLPRAWCSGSREVEGGTVQVARVRSGSAQAGMRHGA